MQIGVARGRGRREVMRGVVAPRSAAVVVGEGIEAVATLTRCARDDRLPSARGRWCRRRRGDFLVDGVRDADRATGSSDSAPSSSSSGPTCAAAREASSGRPSSRRSRGHSRSKSRNHASAGTPGRWRGGGRYRRPSRRPPPPIGRGHRRETGNVVPTRNSGRQGHRDPEPGGDAPGEVQLPVARGGGVHPLVASRSGDRQARTASG